MRVATNFFNQTNLQNLQKSNEQIAIATQQATSGYKAQNFSDLAGVSNQLLTLENLKANTGIYQQNIDTANSRLKVTESTVQNMIDLLEKAATLWTQARNDSSATTRASLAPTAQGLAESFYNLLNTRFDGRYIFSGQNGSQAPTLNTATATAYPGNPPPTTYYTGDTVKAQTLSAPGTITDYGVLGNDVSFARMRSGLEALWYGLSHNSNADIDGSITLLQQAKSDLSNVIGQIGGQESSFELLTTRNTNVTQFLDDRIDSLDKADITEAITQLNQSQATLQASLAVISRVSQLSLLDFLR